MGPTPPALSNDRTMQHTISALAGATETGKGSWTARIRDGKPVYRHVSGFETTDRRVVERSRQTEPGGLR